MKKLISCLIGFVPGNRLRIFFWRVFLKYDISYDSRIGWGNIIYCGSVAIKTGKIGPFNQIFVNELRMNKGSEIRKFNRFKLVNRISMDEDSHINNRNSVVGLFVSSNQHRDDCNFYLGRHSLITHCHNLDCTDEIYIGDNVVFGGKGSQVWTHGFDIFRNMVTGSVTVGIAGGGGIYVGSRCTICQNVSICDRTVIGAATCVSKSIVDSGFYVSNQLIRKGEIKDYSLTHERDF